MFIVTKYGDQGGKVFLKVLPRKRKDEEFGYMVVTGKKKQATIFLNSAIAKMYMNHFIRIDKNKVSGEWEVETI